jgi:hypothetical protein
MAYGLGYATGYADALADNGIMPTVEILLETDPDTYVDIADDYRMFSTFRGRNRELDRFQAGTCQVGLSDLSRDYDPSNTAGPYFGKLKPMRRVKINAHWAGTAYPVFAGYVDSFEHEYAGPANGDATCTIFATDGFKVLQAAELATSAYVQEVLADGPVHFWRLDEPADATIIHDDVGGLHFDGFSETPTFGEAGIVSRDPGSSMLIDHVDEGIYVVGGGPPVVAGNPVTIEVVVSVDTSLGGGQLIFANVNRGSTGFDDELVIRMDATNGKIEWAVWRGTVGTLAESTTTAPMADGQTVHIACVWDAAGAMRIHRDGADVTSGTPTRAPATFAPTTFEVLALGSSASEATDAFFGRYQMVAVYDQALSATRIAAHADQVATPWNNDLPGTRLDRIADAVAWPAVDRDFDTGTSTLQPAELDMSALEHAQKVAESDFGVLFVTADGKLRFIGREGLFNRPQEATFGDGGGAELGYRSLRPEYTDQLIRNDVNVSRLDGVAQRVEDAGSIAEYLRHSYVIDGLFHDSDELSRYAAEFIVSEYKEPQRRISNLIVTPRADPDDLYPQVLGRELADQITVIDRPPGGGDPNEQDSAIEGIAHTVTPMWWETAWNVAPSFGSSGTPAAVGVWGVTKWGQSRWGF